MSLFATGLALRRDDAFSATAMRSSTSPVFAAAGLLDDLRSGDAVPPVSDVWATQHQVLSEGLFKSALLRERKRAYRFSETFVLLSVSIAESDAQPVIQALTSVARRSDLVGWLQQGAVLGLILAEVAACTDESRSELEARVQYQLTSRLSADALAALNLRIYVHDAPNGHPVTVLRDADPLHDHIRAVRERRPLVDILKRALDVVGSLILMIVLSPLFLLVALLVKLTSSGPVLFRQQRVGYMAQPFTILKFRTMEAQVDQALHQQFVAQFIKDGAHFSSHENGRKLFKIQGDPRITSVGRILRRTSVDELPQLWNVLRGEMTLVGPRPPLPYEVAHYRSWHWRRVLEAKPGVTGLWQVRGRSRTTFDEMVRLDLRYVKTRSFWNDVRILLATPRAVITGKGAC
ncbi:MAG: sugar transferase [Vicinamibacterales bacterium]